MSFFTEQEFHQMLFELTRGDAVCYNTLIKIAEKTLYKSVCSWCNQTPVLRNCEEDIMQEIYIRLIKKCVTGFIMRDGVLNDDYEMVYTTGSGKAELSSYEARIWKRKV